MMRAATIRARILRVPLPAELQRWTDLEVAELWNRRGHRSRIATLISAEMDRRDEIDRARARKQAGIDKARARRAAIREDYDLYVHAAWLAAEADCRGVLLSRAGKASGVDPVQLWSMPWPRTAKLASEELLAWWAVNGRWTFGTFQQQAREQRAA
jgi:regulator of protease activity HflC (stomatin/prohibitin superfamily)